MLAARRAAITLTLGVGVIAAVLTGGYWLTGRVAPVATPLHPAPAGAPWPETAWAETAWPFPMDEWGKGHAFRCGAAACGADISVYVRAKIGFCNCATGVDDDTELERLSDFGLMGGTVSAKAGGQPVTIGWMKGRSRAYGISTESNASMLSVAFSNECDALVATAIIDRATRAEFEPRVIDFLNSRAVLQWARATLGLAAKPAVSN